jgi:hypothetical protein
MRALLFLLAAALSMVVAVGSAASATSSAAQSPVGPRCNSQVRTFVNLLGTLDGQIRVGISLTQYQTRLTQLSAASDKIPWKATTNACATKVGVPAVRAFHHLLSAFTVWIHCPQMSCPKNGTLQRYWDEAHGDYERANLNMG